MRLLAMLAATAMLAACSTQEEISDSDNVKVMGKVVSVVRTRDVNAKGAGNIASSGAGAVADRVTGGVFSGIFGTQTSSKRDLNMKEGRIYTVRTDEGNIVKVEIESERVFFPGEEVIIIRNEDGFESIYPRDLHGRHPGGL